MKKSIIHFSARRLGELVGIMLWSAHYHSGQWSREYRMGCRARTLLHRSSETGKFCCSRWFDDLEHYVTGEHDKRAFYVFAFCNGARRKYQSLAKLCGAEIVNGKTMI